MILGQQLREMFQLAINIIVAMDKNGLIGNGNELPWHIPEDLEYFYKTTVDNIVVMGRKTWESLPKKHKPLKNRDNLVLTKNTLNDATKYNNLWVTSVEEILSIPNKFFSMEVFIIGGAEIYKQFYPHCDKLYITYVNDTYEGDVYFPIKITQINEDFEIESRKITDKCEFIVMRRIKDEI